MEIPSAAVNPTAIPIEPSAFSSQYDCMEIGETKYSVRILKMNNSALIYIGVEGKEHLDEMGIAMPMPGSGSGAVGTVALGPQLGCDSQQLAQKLAKRLRKQIYVSCNVPFDRMTMLIFEKKLVHIIENSLELVESA